MSDDVALRWTELVSKSKCHGGVQLVVQHKSKELKCNMKFSIFLPSTYGRGEKLPVVYFLSGLTCTEANFITKSGFQQYAEKYSIVVVGPDTSPRDTATPGETDSWDLGLGAGFYVDATQTPWSKHYRMYSYVTKELRDIVEREFPQININLIGISGHSMGGHGALVAFFRNPQIYKAVTAFAPISNVSKSKWGLKALPMYLGTDETIWNEYDATTLVRRQPQRLVKIIIDQGKKDEWWDYLLPTNFIEACKEVDQPVEYNEREGYDHGYFFVQSFIGEHFKYFSEVLR